MQAQPRAPTGGAAALQGLRHHPALGELGRSEYNALQLGVTAATRTASSSAPPTRSASSQDNASSKRDVLFNAFDDSGYWGNSSFDRRHVFNFYYIYDLPFFRDQTTSLGRVLGGWQISGATFMRTGTPLWVTRAADMAGVGDTFAQPYNQVGDPWTAPTASSRRGRPGQNFWFNPAAFARPGGGHVRQREAQRHLRPGPVPVGHRGVQELRVRNGHSLQFRAEIFNFLNHANRNNPTTDPTSATFGRITGKDNSRRDIQLSLRYVF